MRTPRTAPRGLSGGEVFHVRYADTTDRTDGGRKGWESLVSARAGAQALARREDAADAGVLAHDPTAPPGPHSPPAPPRALLPLPPPSTADEVAEDHLIAPTDGDDLPVMAAEGAVRPPAILDQPGFAYGLDSAAADDVRRAIVGGRDGDATGERQAAWSRHRRALTGVRHEEMGRHGARPQDAQREPERWACDSPLKGRQQGAALGKAGVGVDLEHA
jgi:hypothetical protein